MKKNLKGNIGISIKLLTEKLKKDIITPVPKFNAKRKVKNEFQTAKLRTSDWKDISIGLRTIDDLVSKGLSYEEHKLLSNKKDVSKVKKEIIAFRGVIEEFTRRLAISARSEYELQKRIEMLSNYSEIAQAARDGLLIKQEKRIEKNGDKEKQIIYDTSMTPREVIDILNKFEEEADKIKFHKLDNYLGLGLSIIGVLGAIIKNNQKKEDVNKVSVPLITLGTTVIGGLKLLRGMLKTNGIEEFFKIKDEKQKLNRDLLFNEQISSKAEKAIISDIRDVSKQESKIGNKLENSRFQYNIILDLVVAIISGAYVNNMIQTKENGKIDGKSLASALISLKTTTETARQFINSVQGIVEDRKEEEEFQETCKKVQDIIDQMEEKVYPLKGAKHPFNSVSINNFTGKFYPKKDYESGKTNYSITIKVPEFSMKRGDVVLLSGVSGTGKSTFLRFLKRGDINNRQAIKLDDNEMVDNLGEEYISFRPSINLGDENNVLYQITGKKDISELKQEEQEKIEKLLGELKFNSGNLLKELSTKKFMEFSTGQQRRLALAKVFYRIDDGTSVIIVDESVGNVEDNLIREQLEMIKKYAQNRNVMLILTTHRLDLAEDLATKRYNINKEGLLEELPIKEMEER